MRFRKHSPTPFSNSDSKQLPFQLSHSLAMSNNVTAVTGRVAKTAARPAVATTRPQDPAAAPTELSGLDILALAAQSITHNWNIPKDARDLYRDSPESESEQASKQVAKDDVAMSFTASSDSWDPNDDLERALEYEFFGNDSDASAAANELDTMDIDGSNNPNDEPPFSSFSSDDNDDDDLSGPYTNDPSGSYVHHPNRIWDRDTRNVPESTFARLNDTHGPFLHRLALLPPTDEILATPTSNTEGTVFRSQSVRGEFDPDFNFGPKKQKKTRRNGARYNEVNGRLVGPRDEGVEYDDPNEYHEHEADEEDEEYEEYEEGDGVVQSIENPGDYIAGAVAGEYLAGDEDEEMMDMDDDDDAEYEEDEEDDGDYDDDDVY